jgi:hypothetical protein
LKHGERAFGSLVSAESAEARRSDLRFKRSLRRCGDFFLEELPPDSFVREPRKPRPHTPGGAIALKLPDV